MFVGVGCIFPRGSQWSRVWGATVGGNTTTVHELSGLLGVGLLFGSVVQGWLFSLIISLFESEPGS